MKKSLFVIMVLVCCQILKAESSDSGITTAPLSIYSGGFSVGACKSLTDQLNDLSSVFLKVTYNNMIFIHDNFNLFADIDWFVPGSNFGADFGFNVLFLTSKFKPLVGLGIGVHYFHRDNYSFAENLGFSGKVHGGFLLDISETVTMQFRIPVHVVGNKKVDSAIGFDVGILFSSKYKKVKKLIYN